MLKLLFVSCVLLTSLSARPLKKYSESCDVVEAYRSVEPAAGTLAVTSFGNIEEVQTLLIPRALTEGKYSVTLSNEGLDIYKVDGMDIYLKTLSCVPSTGEDVILVWKSNYGYVKGELISTD